MKRVAIVTMMLQLGVAAVYAQETHVKMTFSGTAGSSTVDLQQPDTSNGEDNFAGNGTLGSFTYRDVRAIANSPTSSSTCSGPNQLFFSESAGVGVFRFQDGSLLKVHQTQGGDCIDFAAQKAHCTQTLQIDWGTGRFKNAHGGNLMFTETTVPLLGLDNPTFFAATGQFAGTVLGVAMEEEPPSERQ